MKSTPRAYKALWGLRGERYRGIRDRLQEVEFNCALKRHRILKG